MDYCPETRQLTQLLWVKLNATTIFTDLHILAQNKRGVNLYGRFMATIKSSFCISHPAKN